MRKILSAFLCIMFLIMTAGCDLIAPFFSEIKENQDTQQLLIGGLDASKNVEVSDENQHFEFELHKIYRVYLQVKDVDYREDLYQTIVNRYNVSTTEMYYSYSNDVANIIAYDLYPLVKSENNQMAIEYNGQLYSFTYDIIDYDFAKYGCKTPSSLSDLDAYPEFTEMINSLSYHEFQSPYVGLDGYSSNYWNEYHWTYDFYDRTQNTYLYNLGYLQYLTDSIYYPTKLDMVNQNPIANRSVSMTFNDLNAVKAGAGRTVMEGFEISYSVIDPCCTNPTYPLQSYSYKAIPKESNATSETTKDTYVKMYYTTYYQLSKAYPEQYFHMTVDNLDISVLTLTSGNNLCAFFEDSTYIYQIYFSYSVVVQE